MQTLSVRVVPGFAILAMLIGSSGIALAQKSYDVGASDTEIKLGNFMPYSGPASAFGVVGKVQAAYFRKINDEGGIRGRKITFISYDDSYSPPKAVEQVRRLVESDEVLAVFGSLGTPSNSAVQKYLNAKKVPQIFLVSGAKKWDDPDRFPWSMGFSPSYNTEGRIYAQYLKANMPQSKIAVMYQNDDFGKDVLQGLREGLGAESGSMIIAAESYEVAEPTIDSHVVKLKSTNADVFINVASPKFAAQAIKKIGELGWRPVQFISYTSSSIGGVLKPAGLDNARGLISAAYAKEASDPQWRDDPGIQAFDAFLKKYAPELDRSDGLVMTGYNHALVMEYVLRQCEDNLTRENVMKQAANIKQLQLGGVLPGILLDTGVADYAPIEQLQLIKFSGQRWERFGDVLDGNAQR